MTALACWNCNASLSELPRPITRHMNCPQCFECLHCCRMCRHFVDHAPGACAEERAEPPVHKEGANFCDYFSPQAGSYRAGSNQRAARAKSSLRTLFGKDAAADAQDTDRPGTPDEAATEADQARRKLDELFR